MIAARSQPKEDTWAFQKIGTAFPPNPVKCLGQQNMYVALWYKHGKPIHGRSWNNGGVVECSFPYKKVELSTARQLEGNIQVLQYSGDHNSQGFWYEWIRYGDRLEKAEGRELVHCGDSFPILWKDRPEGALLGYVDNKTEIALFSCDGKVYERAGPQLNDMYILMRNTVGGPPFCECPHCPKAPPPPPTRPGCTCGAGLTSQSCSCHLAHKCSCGSGAIAGTAGHELHRCACGLLLGMRNHRSHRCSCGSTLDTTITGHESHLCSCGSIVGAPCFISHESHKCSCGSVLSSDTTGHESHKCSCGSLVGSGTPTSHATHKCSCGSVLTADISGHELHKCSCGSLVGESCFIIHESHKCSCGTTLGADISGHESHQCSCGSIVGEALAISHESHKCSCGSLLGSDVTGHESHKCSCGSVIVISGYVNHDSHKCSCGAGDAFSPGHELHKCSCGTSVQDPHSHPQLPGGGVCRCRCTCFKLARPILPPRVMLDEWIDIRAGDPWPDKILVKALNQTLDTIPGENPDQYVALWYQAGEPVMGRVWNENGRVAADFCWNDKEYRGNVGSIQLLVHLSERARGFDYQWLPYPQASSFDKSKAWIPVHVNNAKGDISAGVITFNGKQILGKVDVRNERAAAGFGGKENVLVGPACAANTIVLCRKARPGYKFD
ncbi:hypothetical protein V3C99_007571 [Haemonchus contortus]